MKLAGDTGEYSRLRKAGGAQMVVAWMLRHGGIEKRGRVTQPAGYQQRQPALFSQTRSGVHGGQNGVHGGQNGVTRQHNQLSVPGSRSGGKIVPGEPRADEVNTLQRAFRQQRKRHHVHGHLHSQSQHPAYRLAFGSPTGELLICDMPDTHRTAYRARA